MFSSYGQYQDIPDTGYAWILHLKSMLIGLKPDLYGEIKFHYGKLPAQPAKPVDTITVLQTAN